MGIVPNSSPAMLWLIPTEATAAKGGFNPEVFWDCPALHVLK
jgi:hypothetical protein